MRRIFSDYAYSDGPRSGCFWDETCEIGECPSLDGDLKVDVAVVGGGFTGLTAALYLAQAGVDVAVLEANHIAWGASGRNGGFCCLGGGKLSDAALDRRFGREGRLEWRQAERSAIDHVAAFLRAYGIDADRHSDGETLLAHQAKRHSDLDAHARSIEENFGVVATVHSTMDLADLGMNGPFHGGVSHPLGFALNPRKYLAGLLTAAQQAGARIYEQSPVIRIDKGAVQTSVARVTADAIILATNAYSSDDLPDWLAARYIPAQSTVVATRPLTGEELQDAGWTSQQAVYDTRNLLHYFRLMPDNRMLFGMRGAMRSGPGAEARARERVHSDFERMFPAWAHVERPFAWSGFVNLARDGMPFVGPVPGHPGLFAGLCYHGNGVAMGSYSGELLAQLVLGETPDLYPEAMQRPLSKFPFGRARRIVVPVAYAGMALSDL